MSKINWYSKPIYLLIALALVLSPGLVAVPMAGTAEAAGEVTFFSEDFESGKPVSWEVTNDAGYAFGWQDDDPGSRGALGGCSGTFMIADSGHFAGGFMDTQLRTPQIDCSNYSTVLLEFDHHFEAGSVERGDVDVWDGTAWVNKIQYGTGLTADGTVSMNISDVAAGRPDVQIRWHYCDAWDAEYWEVDNVELSGSYSPPPEPPPPPPPEEETLIFEDFEAGLPADWAVVNNGGGSDWCDDNPSARAALGGCSGRFMIADSANCSVGEFMDTELVTPEIDCSDYGALRLEFNHMFNCVGNETADVDVWNGTAWENLLSFTDVSIGGMVVLIVVSPLSVKRSMSGFDAAPGIAPLGAGGGSDIKIGFHYYDASGNSSGFWEVDNVRLSGVPPPPVGGEAYPVNKFAILAPWIAVMALLAGGISWYTLRRRRTQS